MIAWTLPPGLAKLPRLPFASRKIASPPLRSRAVCPVPPRLATPRHPQGPKAPRHCRAMGTGERSSKDTMEGVKQMAVKAIEDLESAGKPLPGLVVVDLDYTMWPFYCECRSKRDAPSVYPHVPPIFEALSEKGIPVAVASRTPTPEIAKAFIQELGLQDRFLVQEIYPSWSHKTEHFRAIRDKSGIDYERMIFFDDEDRNIQAVGRLGVTSIFCDDGVTIQQFLKGLKSFQTKMKSTTQSF